MDLPCLFGFIFFKFNLISNAYYPNCSYPTPLSLHLIYRKRELPGRKLRRHCMDDHADRELRLSCSAPTSTAPSLIAVAFAAASQAATLRLQPVRQKAKVVWNREPSSRRPRSTPSPLGEHDVVPFQPCLLPALPCTPMNPQYCRWP